jgi:hypothetical protein
VALVSGRGPDEELRWSDSDGFAEPGAVFLEIRQVAMLTNRPAGMPHLQQARVYKKVSRPNTNPVRAARLNGFEKAP